MKYFFIAGEASGDLHAAALMKEILALDPKAEFAFLGGDHMKTVGGRPLIHIRNMAFMGFIPVIKNIRQIWANFTLCKKAIERFQPDKIILVDYPGFNLRMAKYVAKNHPTPVYYFIAPKLWVWKKYRIHAIRKYVHTMLTIFPFETAFFAKLGYPVHYVGNPIVDAVNSKLDKTQLISDFTSANGLSLHPLIAVLPGSRKQEIALCLPTILKALSAFQEHQIVIAGAPGVEPEFYQTYLKGHRATILFNQTYSLVRHARVAVVNSGTATLETMLIGTPQVVVYQVKPAWLASIGKRLFLKTKYISLVNIIAGKEVVPELVAHSFRVQNLQHELAALIYNPQRRWSMTQQYDAVKQLLGDEGCAKRAAAIVCSE